MSPTQPSEPTRESLRVDPDAFHAMIDRSAGGPAYRRLIRILKAVLGLAAVAAVVGVAVTLLALSQFGQVVQRLDEGADEAKAQRELILEQNRLLVAQGQALIECTTPSPLAGTPPPGDDGVHECYDQGQARGERFVDLVFKAQIAVAECARSGADDLVACATGRLDPSGPLGPSPTVARTG